MGSHFGFSVAHVGSDFVEFQHELRGNWIGYGTWKSENMIEIKRDYGVKVVKIMNIGVFIWPTLVVGLVLVKRKTLYHTPSQENHVHYHNIFIVG